MTTNTHNTSMSTEERKKYQKLFAEMARKEILVWRDFHEWWLQQKVPILVIRYEDLIRYTDEVISKVIKFVLEVKDMDFFEKRIDRFIRQESVENIGAYRPRSGGIGKSLTKVSSIGCKSVDNIIDGLFALDWFVGRDFTSHKLQLLYLRIFRRESILLNCCKKSTQESLQPWKNLATLKCSSRIHLTGSWSH